MNLLAISQHLVMRGQRHGQHTSRRDERLRLAGYADGERQPRKPAHWANR